jgi:hypothetical protein
MACMTLPWAPVATLINSLRPPAAALASASRIAARRGGDAGSWKLRHGRAADKPDGRCAGSRIVR